MTDITITAMTADDAIELSELDKQCFDVPWSEKAFLDEADNDIAVYFVAHCDGKCIGYAGFWNVCGEGDITNIAVLSEYRRKGIASRIMAEMIKEACELSLEMLTLEVRRSNTPAQELYKKFGFEVIGERKRYYSDNREDALIMAMKLSPSME